MRRKKDSLRISRDGKPANIEGLWSPNPAFLVCNGASLQTFPLSCLKERGVASLGVNNAAAKAPVKAWVFSDPQSKFHHGLFLDPTVMTFAPKPKLRRRIRMKMEDGFYMGDVRVRSCPNTYEYDRSTQFVPEKFFTTTFCHWGNGKHQPSDVESAGCLATLLIGIRLLFHLGVRKIYLLGVDHAGSRRRWAKEDKALERLIPQFEKYGLLIFNCYRESNCRVFEQRSFDEAVIDCKGSVPNEPLDTDDWYAKKKVAAQCEGRVKLKPVHY